MIGSDSGQQQASFLTGDHLQAVSSDCDLSDSRFTRLGDFLRTVEQPDFEIELIEFVGRDGRESGVLACRIVGRSLDGFVEPDRLSLHAHAAAELAGAFEADEGTGEDFRGGTGEGGVGPIERLVEHGSGNGSGGGMDDRLLLRGVGCKGLGRLGVGIGH